MPGPNGAAAVNSAVISIGKPTLCWSVKPFRSSMAVPNLQIVNAATSVLLADITSGLVGVCASTFLIVIFGEVIRSSHLQQHRDFVHGWSCLVTKGATT
jgi:CBS domain containing-hemolysin-like protein